MTRFRQNWSTSLGMVLLSVIKQLKCISYALYKKYDLHMKCESSLLSSNCVHFTNEKEMLPYSINNCIITSFLLTMTPHYFLFQPWRLGKLFCNLPLRTNLNQLFWFISHEIKIELFPMTPDWTILYCKLLQPLRGGFSELCFQ